MKITELEIHNLGDCRYTKLNFSDKSPVFLIHSPAKCEVVTLATQLICTSKYDNLDKLTLIREQTKLTKITMTFKLTWTDESEGNDVPTVEDHSSDSDVPCTSRQAYERAQKRQRNKRKHIRLHSTVITACRDFTVNPLIIVYVMGNNQTENCSVYKFHRRFFSCTSLIFPRLSDLENGNFCNGRWLDLLNTDYIYNGNGENHFIRKFCELYSEGKLSLGHTLSKLTTATLIGSKHINKSRISNLLYIFQDIRCVFEYITCSEYTVWFLLPSTYGDLQDITEITTNNINFDLMKTKIQLKTRVSTTGQSTNTSSPKYLWTEARGYVQELFLVAVEIAFGYHCGQNIIYLNNLQKLNEHQSFEYIRTSYARRSGTGGQWIENDYLQRIVNVCVKFNLTCVLEYPGGIAFEPENAFIIMCEKRYRKKDWIISLKTSTDGEGDTDANNANVLLKAVQRVRERRVRFHPDAKY